MKLMAVEPRMAVAESANIAFDLSAFYGMKQWSAIVLYDSVGHELARNPQWLHPKEITFRVFRPGNAAAIVFYD